MIRISKLNSACKPLSAALRSEWTWMQSSAFKGYPVERGRAFGESAAYGRRRWNSRRIRWREVCWIWTLKKWDLETPPHWDTQCTVKVNVFLIVLSNLAEKSVLAAWKNRAREFDESDFRESAKFGERWQSWANLEAILFVLAWRLWMRYRARAPLYCLTTTCCYVRTFSTQTGFSLLLSRSSSACSVCSGLIEVCRIWHRRLQAPLVRAFQQVSTSIQVPPISRLHYFSYFSLFPSTIFKQFCFISHTFHWRFSITFHALKALLSITLLIFLSACLMSTTTQIWIFRSEVQITFNESFDLFSISFTLWIFMLRNRSFMIFSQLRNRVSVTVQSWSPPTY